jgi:hypothetical protein
MHRQLIIIKILYVRYKYKNIHVPTPHLAIFGLRIFGTGQGKTPSKVKNFIVTRHQDRRDATITWDARKDCQGYNVLFTLVILGKDTQI